VVVNQERKEGNDPNQLRPTVLPRGIQVKPTSVVSPMSDAGRSSGLRACRLVADSLLSTASQLPRVSAKVESFSLTAAGQPRIHTGFPFDP